jgi:hypothetical protein
LLGKLGKNEVLVENLIKKKMMNNKNPMDEIREVRERIYEEIKNLSPEERLNYFEEGSKKFEQAARELQLTMEQKK